jgi:hypothetical protein
MQNLLERAFVEPFVRLAEQFVAVIAPLLTVFIILIIGGAVAYLLRLLVFRLLTAVNFDRLVDQTGTANAVMRTRVFHSPSDFGARVVQGLLWLLIILMALDAAGTELTRGLVERFFQYIPDMVAATLVLLLGSAISKFLARSALLAAVNAQMAGARLIAGGVRVFIMFLAVVIALEQLQIGRAALLISFAILFGGLVLAVSIAFGLGARDLVREWLQEKASHPKTEEEDVMRHL